MSYVVLRRIRDSVSLVSGWVFDSRQEALDTLRDTLRAGADEEDAEYVVLDVDAASPVLVLPLAAGWSAGEESVAAVAVPDGYEDAVFVGDLGPSEESEFDVSPSGPSEPAESEPAVSAPLEVVVEEIVVEAAPDDEIEESEISDEAAQAEALAETIEELAAEEGIDTVAVMIVPEEGATPDAEEVAQALDELLPHVESAEEVLEAEPGDEAETEAGAASQAGVESESEGQQEPEAALGTEPEPEAAPEAEAHPQPVPEPEEEAQAAPQAVAATEQEPDEEREEEMPGYEVGESDLDSLTCDDCVYVTTCPNKDERTPSACGSFQWVSV